MVSWYLCNPLTAIKVSLVYYLGHFNLLYSPTLVRCAKDANSVENPTWKYLQRLYAFKESNLSGATPRHIQPLLGYWQTNLIIVNALFARLMLNV